jgi:predicted amidohydrolase YtcJ
VLVVKLKLNGEPTGILVDNPMELVFKIIPKPKNTDSSAIGCRKGDV